MQTNRLLKLMGILVLIAATITSTGCASTRSPKDPEDPYETYNRKVFKFNLAVDRHIYRPVARAYDKITPKPVHRGITNFFSNINDITAIADDILQFNFPWAASDTGRVVINSTLGVGGLFDAASHMGLKKHNQDFGLTMAKWGVRESPYLMVPFFAPSTPRDFLGSLVDYQFLSVYPYINPNYARYAVYGLYLVNQRAAYLSTDKLVDEAFDPYIFVRNAYMQKRRAEINKVLGKDPDAESGEETQSDDSSASSTDTGDANNTSANSTTSAQTNSDSSEAATTSKSSNDVGNKKAKTADNSSTSKKGTTTTAAN